MLYEKSRNCISIQKVRNFIHVSIVGMNDDQEELLLQLKIKKISIEVGETHQLAVKNVKASNVKWYSSDETIAIVTEEGTVRGIVPGKAKITGKYNGKKYSCNVTVKKSDVICYVASKEDMNTNTCFLMEDMVQLKEVDEDDESYVFVAYPDSVKDTIALLKKNIPYGTQDGAFSYMEFSEDLSTINIMYGPIVKKDSITRDRNINKVKDLVDYIYLYKFLSQESIEDVTFNFYHSEFENNNKVASNGVNDPIDTITLKELMK